MKRRGQAALEFLTTYGWALLVILVMIGALVYFGLLNPSRILPNKCTVTTGFVCEDYQITEDSISVVLSNKLGSAITNVDLNQANVTSVDFLGVGPNACTVSATTVNADERFTLSCTAASPADMFEGLTDKVNVNIKAGFVPTKQVFGKTLDITLYAPVQ